MTLSPSLFKTNPKGKEAFDLQEVFSLSSLLATRYLNIHTIQILRNFVHDRDLYLVMTRIMDVYQVQAQGLEDRASKAQIKVPNKPPKDQNTSNVPPVFSDEYIFGLVRKATEDDVFVLSRAVRSSTTNDSLRAMFVSHLKNQLSNIEIIIRYGKVKGWPETVPTFKLPKTTTTESLNVGEAYNLWDHISLRYDQWQLTEFFAGFAHDVEYRAILNAGTSQLKKQAGELEKVMLKEEVPLPSRPPESMKTPIDPESLEDEFTYRTIFRGIQEAIDLHLRAIVGGTRNDSLRQLFNRFLFDEISLLDRFLRYGKAKGWTHVPPVYAEPT